jgi:hypothetical protein
MPRARSHLKILIGVLAAALVGSASAGGWRDLRVDGSSEEAFEKSLEAFKEKLSSAREYVFGEALKDIWNQGVKAAEVAQREYTPSDYYADVHGLTYEEVVTFTDPTGDTAKRRYRIAPRPFTPGGSLGYASGGGLRWGTDSNGHPLSN